MAGLLKQARFFGSFRPKFNPEIYTEHSYLPTYHFQNALPRLPIPSLEASCNKYIESIEALEGHPQITIVDIDRAKKLTEEFKTGIGKDLHKKLIEFDAKNPQTSYIYEMWNKTYLADRRPLPITFNPWLCFRFHSNKQLRTLPIRATQTIISSAKFFKTLEANLLQPEVFFVTDKAKKSKVIQRAARYLPNTKVSIKKFGIENQSLRFVAYAANDAYPLDMSQFENLFNSTRIPEPKMDRIQKATNKRRFVTVFHRGRVYKLNAFDEKWNIRKAEAIMGDINAILEHGEDKPINESVPALTTLSRDDWTAAREHLITLGNGESLNDIDESLFAVVLDEQVPQNVEDQAMNFMAGDARSRWFDKSFQIIIQGDSSMCMNYEHAWGDGIPNLRYMESIYDDMEKSNSVTLDLKPQEGTIDEIKFNLDETCHKYIQKAIRLHEERKSKIETKILPFGNAPAYENQFMPADSSKDIDFSRTWLRKNKLGPDGFIQLSYQIAYHQLKGFPTSVYESVSTAAFKHGRTETMRPVTTPSNQLLTDFKNCDFDKKDDRDNLALSIRTAIRAHNKNTKAALQGEGFDRHFYALQQMAINNNIEIPDIFKDQNHTVLNKFLLSTSTLNSESIMYGGFGPQIDGGYGVGYMVFDDWSGTCVAGFKDSSEPGQYLDTLQDVWKKMISVF